MCTYTILSSKMIHSVESRKKHRIIWTNIHSHSHAHWRYTESFLKTIHIESSMEFITIQLYVNDRIYFIYLYVFISPKWFFILVSLSYLELCICHIEERDEKIQVKKEWENTHKCISSFHNSYDGGNGNNIHHQCCHSKYTDFST